MLRLVSNIPDRVRLLFLISLRIVNIRIGWTFKETLEKVNDGVHVRFESLNSVLECFRGSGEDINAYEEKRSKQKTA